MHAHVHTQTVVGGT